MSTKTKSPSKTECSNKQSIKQELFKTEQCKNWILYGTCRYGDACKFAHGFIEQRSRDRHGKYKTSLCKDYPLGKCTFGIRCNFAHSTSELLTSKNEYKLIPDAREPDYLFKKESNIGKLEYESLISNIMKLGLDRGINASRSNQDHSRIYNRSLPPNRGFCEDEQLIMPESNYQSRLGYVQNLNSNIRKFNGRQLSDMSNNSRLGNRLQPEIHRNEGYNGINRGLGLSLENKQVSNNEIMYSVISNNGINSDRYSESKISPFFGQKLQNHKIQNHFENKTGILLGSHESLQSSNMCFKRSLLSDLDLSKGELMLDNVSINSLSDSHDESLDLFSGQSSPSFNQSSETGKDYTLGYLETLGVNAKKPANAAF
ncbi:Zinc finger protein zfs1 [Smittium mucronatum]|uniref:Zinc finger protein zfs1 n=1 Tax=Smittium mucronatum TaxID=133383 RepID=A0A1R0H548_9FUNG|nr:Zinc finger protein zfs1 [Smittium mucronatum]